MKEEKMKAKKNFYDYWLEPENKKNLLQVVEDTKRGIRKKSIFFYNSNSYWAEHIPDF